MSKLTHLPPFLLIPLVLRLLVMGAGIGDALAVIGLATLYAFYLQLQSKKEPIANKALIDRIVELEESAKITREKINVVTLAANLRR